MLERVVRDRKFPKFGAIPKHPGLEPCQQVVPEDEGVKVSGPVHKIVRSDFTDLEMLNLC